MRKSHLQRIGWFGSVVLLFAYVALLLPWQVAADSPASAFLEGRITRAGIFAPPSDPLLRFEFAAMQSLVEVGVAGAFLLYLIYFGLPIFARQSNPGLE